jgi:hypothetical protein
MPAKYKKLIADYCAANGIAVPLAFDRHPPSRYAIVRIHQAPPKLIAKTWFAAADVLYYLEHFLVPELGDTLSDSIQILDFQAAEVLTWDGGQQLNRLGTIALV